MQSQLLKGVNRVEYIAQQKFEAVILALHKLNIRVTAVRGLFKVIVPRRYEPLYFSTDAGLINFYHEYCQKNHYYNDLLDTPNY